MSTVEHRSLRPAIEFAVAIVREAGKQRTPIDHPAELDPFLKERRIPNSALGRLRRAIETDATFRSRLSAGAIPELVDEIGRLWLAAEPGWAERAMALEQQAVDEAADETLRAQLQRAQRQRDAAERAAVRLRADAVAARAERDEAVAARDAALAAADDALRRIAAADDDLRLARRAERHARDRERAAQDRLAAHEQRAATTGTDGSAVSSTPTVLGVDAASIADVADRVAAEVAALRHLAHNASHRSEPGPSAGNAATPGRTPLPIPGGVISTSAEAAEFLLRSGALVVVDGYNVAKRGWPGVALDEQRGALLARVENLVSARGVDLVVVFDGADVVGAHAPARRQVRVVFSPAGVTADDIIRDIVDATDDARHVVVVTDDREIIDDVRRAGANTIAANAFLAVR
ncbi:MAG: NYN domain-containing protein [Actinomycetota bacterium]